MQHVATADRVAGHHRHDRLGHPPDLDLEVEHVQPADAVLVDVAVVAADLLVTTAAERVGSLARQHDHADRRVVAGHIEGVDQLTRRERTERVAHLGTVDGDLRDALGGLVADVGPLAGRFPRNAM